MLTDTKPKRKSFSILEIISPTPPVPKLAGFSKMSTVLDVRITHSITRGLFPVFCESQDSHVSRSKFLGSANLVSRCES